MFKDKNWQLCYDYASEAIRLNPRKKEYLGNRAAAGLKLKAKKYLRQAAEDSVTAYEMDDKYTKAYLRAAEAHMVFNERATVKLAVKRSSKRRSSSIPTARRSRRCCATRSSPGRLTLRIEDR